MDFKQYLEEAKEKTAVMAFGRFNPPTVGHEKLIQKVKAVSDEHGASGHVFASHTELKSKDPLPQAAKIGYLNQISVHKFTVPLKQNLRSYTLPLNYINKVTNTLL